MATLSAICLLCFVLPLHVIATKQTKGREFGMVLVKEDHNSYIDVNVHSLRQRRQAEEKAPKPKIVELHAQTVIKSRYAKTVVTTGMKNTQTSDLEATLYVQFPVTAFISNFTMEVNDELFVGVVKEKKEAQDIYDKAKERNETAGIVKSYDSPDVEPGMEIFSITTNLAADSTAVFVLTYEELLVRKHDYTHYLYVDPQQPVDEFSLSADVEEPQGIKTIKAFSADRKPLNVVLSGNTKASVKYNPTLAKQGKGIKGLIKVVYDVDTSCDAGVFHSCGSYFVHYFSTPSGTDCSLSVMGRRIYFVIDISGSMSGTKMTQTRAAMDIILKLLRPNDIFGIILFDDEVVEWKSEMFAASQDNVNDALRYCGAELKADGGTNIYGPLKKALERMSPVVSNTDSYAPYIMFLTDGSPNSGEFSTTVDILREIQPRNVKKIPIYSIGFGAGADMEFLSALSQQSGGYAIKIFDGTYDQQDMSEQLEFFYSRIASPLLKDVKFVYPKTIVLTNEVTDMKVAQYFDGMETIVTGRVQEDGAPSTFVVTVTGQSASGQKDFTTTVNKADYGDCDLIERIFAYKWIKSLLLQVAMETDETKKKSLEDEALRMSLKYNFVTPLTSMVVVQDKGSDMPIGGVEEADMSVKMSGGGFNGGWSLTGQFVTVMLLSVATLYI